ncbi:MAG: tetratricopeptide repeat protein [Prolixibacteraceae bacterium]|nr:tetratricopeptide repeat protein [Prolixibacteraceae bacterium]
MKNNINSIEESLEAVQRASKMRQSRFWALSIIWVVVVVVAILFFINLLNKFEQNRISILQNSERLENVTMRLEIMTKENKELFRRLIDLEEYYYSQLGETEKKDKVQDIARRELSRQYITPGQKQFLESETKTFVDSNRFEYWYLEALSKDAPTAVEYLNNAIRLNPGMEAAYCARGRAYKTLKDYKKAIDDYSRALELNSNSVSSLAERSFAYFKYSYDKNLSAVQEKDALENALKDAENAVKMSPDYWVPHHYLGFIYLKMKEFNKAEEEWGKAADLNIGLESTAGSLENLGLVYLWQQNWQKAKENCLNVSSVYEDLAWNWCFLFISADKLNDKKLAIEAKGRWDKIKTEDDIEVLKLYLPVELHRYL